LPASIIQSQATKEEKGMIKGIIMSLVMAVAFWIIVNLIVIPHLPFWIVAAITAAAALGLGGKNA
jgi:hypothetical protein